MGLYNRALLPLLHRLSPETAHALTLRVNGALQHVPLYLQAVEAVYSRQDPRLAFTWRGLAFRNPIGLAAGADKDALVPRFFGAAGMGFIEIGTVTPEPQPGNPRPRMWRIPSERAMVNRLGFPSQGAQRVAGRLARLKDRGIPLGVNIGKNAVTPLDRAADDYARCLEVIYPYGDYFVVNVSSPNTEGLTSLQTRPALAALLDCVLAVRNEQAKKTGAPPKPLLVKLSADLTDPELDDAAEVCVQRGADGIIAVNTSTNSALRTPASARLQGGLSGKPLLPRAQHAVERLRQRVPNDFFIIGVGGVFDADDAWALIQAGANAVQLYTGLVYKGPAAVAQINRGLVRKLEQAGFSSITQAVGRR